MSELKKILEEVKVEWKFLADEIYIEIANSARKPIKASLRTSGNTPYYGANNIQDYVEGKTHSGEYVLIAEDGSSNLNNYSIQYAQGDFWANNHVHVLRGINGLNTKFLFHCLKIVNFIPYLTGGERAKLTKGNLLQIQIPIPCPDNPEKSLKIQQEIVRILDSLSEETNQLTAALQKELKIHQKRYNYYREELFTFEGKEVEWKSLGDLCFKISSGKNKEKSEVGKYPLYGSTGIIGKTNTKAYNSSKILVARVGANAGYVHVASGEYDVSDNALVIENKEELKSQFLFYYLVNHKLNRFAKGAGQPLITGSFLKELSIPLCPLEEQERIVRILDDLDAKTQAITTAIQKEVALRNKQYEYYRDRLLSFQSLQTEAEAIQ